MSASKFWNVALTGVLASALLVSIGAAATGARPDAGLVSYQVARWTAENGLPQNQVKALVQTRDGYLWIGTLNGLARFDGARFTVFDHGNTPEMFSDAINDLAEDAQDGSLWIATGNGLLRLHGHRFERYGAERGMGDVGILAPSREGGAWCELGPGNLGRVRDGQARAWKLEPHPGWNACRFLGEKSASVVRAVVDHDLYEFDVESREAREIGPPAEKGHCNSFRYEADGGLWLAAMGGIWRRQGSQWTQVMTTSDLAHGPWPEAIKRTSDGRIWVTTIRGDGRRDLYLLAGSSLAAFAARDFPADAGVTRVLEDREGSVWIGSQAGLFRLRPRHLQVYSRSDGLRNDDVQAVTLGADGTVWLGTEHWISGIREGQITNLPARDAHQELPWTGVLLAQARGGLLAVWPGREVISFEDGHWRSLRALSEMQGGLDSPSALLEDREQRIWVRTTQGIACLDQGQWTYYTNDAANASVRVIYQDHRNDLWFGTFGAGLHRLHEGRISSYATTRGELNNRAWWIHEDADGVFWVGSQDGLNRFVPPGVDESRKQGRLTPAAANGASGRFFTFTKQHGLHENIINNIQEDDFGYLWLSGLRGIYRVSRQELNEVAAGRCAQAQVLALGEADGMLSSECNGGDNQPAGCKDRQGRIWFPTTKGVVVIDPKTIRRNDVPPPVVIEQVKADGEAIFGDGVGADVRRPSPTRNSQLGDPAEGHPDSESGLTSAPTVRLGPGRARVLEVRYTANSFVAPERIRFRYRLDGWDQGWREADSTERVAFYTNLRPGPYTFRVTACNNHGVWNETPGQFAFVLAPYIWQTWPFYVASGLFALSSALALHYRRLQGLRRVQRLEQQRTLQEERARIARDLHDDLGASLTGVALQLEAAQRRGHAEGQQLALLAGETRSLAHELRELAWTTNPRCDNTISLAAFIGELAERFCEAAGLECKLDLPSGEGPRAVPARVRHELLIVVKESLANVARHAAARQVTVALATSRAEVRVVIQDDGCGFDASRAAGGSGLRNLQERLQQLGGSFEIESRPGAGTSVTAALPLGHSGHS
jgi:signal transduction histidine kinase/ligand-binding sensor domain-containing protein